MWRANHIATNIDIGFRLHPRTALPIVLIKLLL